MSRVTLARAALVISLACILGATLTPVGTEFQPDFVSCIICGGRGWADATANLLLFAPLGVALAWNGRTGLRAVGYAFLLSSCIELSQTMIPGRDPSLGDVTFNTLGSVAGQIAAFLARRWLVPDTVRAARLSLAAAGLAVAAMALTGILLAPVFPSSGGLSIWYAPSLQDMPWYHVRVLATRLGGQAIRPGPLPAQAAQMLRSGEPLFITAIAGAPLPDLGAILVIEDDHAAPLYLVGPDWGDLAVRVRTRAATWGLDQPDIRLYSAFNSITAGDTLRIGIHHRAVDWCLSVNERERCGLGHTLGDAWATVLYPRHWPPWSHRLLGVMWMGGLALPVGLWTQRRVESTIAIALFGGAVALVPSVVALLQTPPIQWCGAGLGWAAGLGLQAMLRRRADSGAAPILRD